MAPILWPLFHDRPIVKVILITAPGRLTLVRQLIADTGVFGDSVVLIAFNGCTFLAPWLAGSPS